MTRPYYGTGINRFYETIYLMYTNWYHQCKWASDTDHLGTLQHVSPHHGSMLSMSTFNGLNYVYNAEQKSISMGVHQLQRLESTSME